MSEMIERVAAAIIGTMFAPHELPLPDDLADKYRQTARAVIEAMREPTEEMLAESTGEAREWLKDDWHCLIDAALA